MRYEDVHRPEQTTLIDYGEPVKFSWSRDTPVMNRIGEQPVLAQRLILGRNFHGPLYLPDGNRLMSPSINEVLSLTLLPPNALHIPLGQYIGYMESHYPTEFGVWDRLLTFGRYGQAVFARLGNFTSLILTYDSQSGKMVFRRATEKEKSEIGEKLKAIKAQGGDEANYKPKTAQDSVFALHPTFREVHAFVREPSSILPLEDILVPGSASN